MNIDVIPVKCYVITKIKKIACNFILCMHIIATYLKHGLQHFEILYMQWRLPLLDTRPCLYNLVRLACVNT